MQAEERLPPNAEAVPLENERACELSHSRFCPTQQKLAISLDKGNPISGTEDSRRLHPRASTKTCHGTMPRSTCRLPKRRNYPDTNRSGARALAGADSSRAPAHGTSCLSSQAQTWNHSQPISVHYLAAQECCRVEDLHERPPACRRRPTRAKKRSANCVNWEGESKISATC